MKHLLLRRWLGALGLLILVNTLWAGGWPQPKGHGYFKIGQWWVIADQHFTDVGGIDPNVTNGIFNTFAYAEYGLTDRLTAVAYFPFFSRTYFNNTVSGTTGELLKAGEAVNSIGDTDFSLRYAWIPQGKVVLSSTLLLGLPTGKSQGGSDGVLQTGDGEFNQLLRMDAGTSFRLGKQNAYANAYFGFNNRTRGFSDELRFGVEAGVGLAADKLYLTLRLDGVESLNNGDPTNTPNPTSVFANNAEFLAISPEVAYFVTPRWGVSVGAGGAFSGRLIYARPSYNVGVFFKL